MTDAPTLQAFQAAKLTCGDALLLFRLSGYFESFYDDARMLARVCGLLVTSPRNSDMPMCGFPVHQLDQHVKALVAAGERVAVCEATGQDQPTMELAGQRMLFAID